MTKEQADKIAQKIANDWKLFWMSQTQNSKQDYDNYFRRALAVDANMRAHLESLISAALVDASKVTECAEFESAFEKTFKTYPVMPMDKLFLDFWNTAFIAGQNSKSLRLPSNTEWTPQKAINEVLEYCEPHLDDMWAARIVGCLLNCDFRDAKEQLKKLNEGK